MAQFSLSIAERSKADRYPEELRALLPPDWPQVPLVRISACGPLTIEVLREVTPDHEGGWQLSYGSPEASLLRRKGTSTALTLLRLLVSQSNGFAARDWLMEKLRRGGQPRDELAGGGLVRLDNIVSLLRGLLCPPSLPDEEHLRKCLLSYVPTSGESGGGYRLAGAPLLWLDVEALAAHVRQARQAEQAGQSAQADWEAAYHLGMRGRFLPEEPYSDWAARRREEVESFLWQSVQALWRPALARHDEEEAQRLLQTYWQEHVEHEEALRPLLELLGQRGEIQRSEQYYARLCAALDELGQEPDPRTQAIMTSLREKQRQQHAQSTAPAIIFPDVPFTSPLPPSQDAIPLPAQGIAPALSSPAPPSHVPDGAAAIDADPTLLVGMGLAQSVSALAPLLQQNWSLDGLLDALCVLAPVAKTMPTVSQHTLLQVGMAPLVGSLPMMHQKHITEEARLRLCQAFDESIAAGWQLFTMAKH
ncbi:MAG: hypothetical protein J2P37_19125, partial [Ktedonobacteraceae bacterium]|nr:hypothetical protein [Ktedonobacteraceae bacterium]